MGNLIGTIDGSGKDVGRGKLSDYLGVPENNSSGRFYSVKNSAGGEVHVSSDEIIQKDFEDIVHFADGNVNIFTGVHGDLEGNVIPHAKFYEDDLDTFGHLPNVKVHNMDGINPKEMYQLINSNDTSIMAWCHSELNPMARMIKVK